MRQNWLAIALVAVLGAEQFVVSTVVTSEEILGMASKKDGDGGDAGPCCGDD